MKPFIEQVFKAAVDEFGVEGQLNVAAEECAELIQAIIKKGRAERGQYWGGSRRPQLEDKAQEAHQLKCIESIVKETTDVQLMLDQIRFMLPGKYAEAYEQALQRFAQEMHNRGYKFVPEAST